MRKYRDRRRQNWNRKQFYERLFSENKKRLFKTEGKNKIMKILRFHILRRWCSSQRKIWNLWKSMRGKNMRQRELDKIPYVSLIAINLYFCTNFNNHWLLEEKLGHESSRRLQAALEKTLEGEQCVCKGRTYVVNHRPNRLVDMKNWTNTGMDEGKNYLNG